MMKNFFFNFLLKDLTMEGLFRIPAQNLRPAPETSFRLFGSFLICACLRVRRKLYLKALQRLASHILDYSKASKVIHAPPFCFAN